MTDITHILTAVRRPEPREAEPDPDREAAEALLQEQRDKIDRLSPEQLKALAESQLTARFKADIQFDLPTKEIGLGGMFVRLAVDRFLYSVAERRWLAYNPERGVWEPNEAAAREEVKRIIAATIANARANLRAVQPIGTPEQIAAANKALQLAMGLQREKAIGATLDVARTSPLLTVAGPQAFDLHLDRFAVANGVINLRTGELMPHAPGNMVRNASPVVYDPAAQCPRWEQFLNEVTKSDANYSAYLRDAVGYTLTGEVSDEVMFFMYGTGSNGKSVFVNVLSHIFGDYATTIDSKMLMASRHGDSREGASPGMLSIVGKRLVLANEVEEGSKFSSNQVKTLAGSEAISARPLYGDPIVFWPNHKLWQRGNSKPIVTETTIGIWRRILLLPFNAQFSKKGLDPLLTHKLIAESPGILRWAVEGAKRWYANGNRLSRPPLVVLKSTREYRNDSDLVGQWLGDRCRLDEPSVETLNTLIYASYSDWANKNGYHPLSAAMLTKKLAERGVEVVRKRDGKHLVRFYVGNSVLL